MISTNHADASDDSQFSNENNKIGFEEKCVKKFFFIVFQSIHRSHVAPRSGNDFSIVLFIKWQNQSTEYNLYARKQQYPNSNGFTSIESLRVQANVV